MTDEVGLEPQRAVDVVAVVTSAGGLLAMSVVFRDLPNELPAAVIVQQHMGGHVSLLTKILATKTQHAFAWAVDGAAVQPGPALVCPPSMRLEVRSDRTFAVIERQRGEWSHDLLLRSLAEVYGSRVLAVGLTGSGHDGAAGAAAVKAAGGIVLAQSTDTAEYQTMPGAIAKAGGDLVLPLREIGAAVADVVRGAPLLHPAPPIDPAPPINQAPPIDPARGSRSKAGD